MFPVINEVNFVGNVVADADLQTSQNGNQILNFRVCINDGYFDRNGLWIEEQVWIPVSMFGSQCQHLARHLVKGARVTVHGKLHTSQWKTKEGESRSKLEIVGKQCVVHQPQPLEGKIEG